MESSRKNNKARGAVAILFAVVGLNRALQWGRGTPAFIVGMAGGLLLVLGIFFFFRKD